MVFLKALFALPISDAEQARYRHHTGRVHPPTHAVREPGWWSADGVASRGSQLLSQSSSPVSARTTRCSRRPSRESRSRRVENPSLPLLGFAGRELLDLRLHEVGGE